MAHGCAYAVTDDVATAWRKFACNILRLHDATAGKARHALHTGEAAIPQTYLDDLYPFRPVRHIQLLTHRLNGVMLPVLSVDPRWSQPSNLTWMHIPAQRRESGRQLSESTSRLLGRLRDQHGIRLNDHPIWDGWSQPPVGEHISLTHASTQLSQALSRLRITGGIETNLPRVHVMTAQREMLMADLPLESVVDERLTGLFVKVQQDLTALL